jgi:hypothetical protein
MEPIERPELVDLARAMRAGPAGCLELERLRGRYRDAMAREYAGLRAPAAAARGACGTTTITGISHNVFCSVCSCHLLRSALLCSLSPRFYFFKMVILIGREDHTHMYINTHMYMHTRAHSHLLVISVFTAAGDILESDCGIKPINLLSAPSPLLILHTFPSRFLLFPGVLWSRDI